MPRIRTVLLSMLAAVSLAASAQTPRLMLIDQDGSGPAGSNQMAMMVLLQSPAVKVLGITQVSGNAWEPEEVRHTLRMLELIHRTDVPVDVDTARGPNCGDTLSWTAANRPKTSLQPVHVQLDLDSARFDTMFVDLMKSPPLKQ